MEDAIMGINYLNKPATAPTAVASAPMPKTQTQKKRVGGGVKPKAPVISLSEPGRLRVANLLALYNIGSANTLYTWLHFKKIPPPDGRDPRPFWLTSTIAEHLKSCK
jgi:hypothetical protein